VLSRKKVLSAEGRVLSEDEAVGNHGKDIVNLKYQVWPQPHVMIFVED